MNICLCRTRKSFLQPWNNFVRHRLQDSRIASSWRSHERPVTCRSEPSISVSAESTAQSVCKGHGCPTLRSSRRGPSRAGVTSTLPELQGVDRVRIEITPATDGLRLWAFVSVTNNETQHVTVIAP